MQWLNKLERKLGKIAIPNLMLLVVILMFVVFMVDMMFPASGLYYLLTFNRDAILEGQVWRLLSFALIPPASRSIWILISLYFYYFVGSSLEASWGSFKFNIYYFCGLLATIASGFITGYAENSFLNLSLFFAFAMLYPNLEVRLFFILPVKIKWLAWLDGALFLFQFIFGSWSTRATIIVSLLNFFLFFGKNFIDSIKQAVIVAKNRRRFKNQWRR